MVEADRDISVVGLGKLGAPIAAAWAMRGFNVIGVDCDPAKVQAINEGQAPVHEPGLAALLKETAGRLSATTELAQAVRNSTATFLIVPTPSGQDGRFSLRYVLPACEEIGRALSDTDHDHLVVLTSTVMPGDTNGPVRETLELASGRRIGDRIGLCYSPEFVALGSVIHDFLNQELLLIGQSDERSGDRLEKMTRHVVVNEPSATRLSLVNAELAKLAVNTYVTTKITFANMLSNVCQRLPGGDVDVVTQAIGLDSRIGRRYLRGGLGYGGPCFPRDNLALSALARGLEVKADLADSVDNINRRSSLDLAGWIGSLVGPGQTVAVLGLAYKPDTDMVEESQGMILVNLLDQERIPVVVYDPVARDAASSRLPTHVKIAATLDDAVGAADVIVITTPWEEFRGLTGARLARTPNRRILVDCWRCLDPSLIEPEAKYVAMGRGPNQPERQDRWLSPVTAINEAWDPRPAARVSAHDSSP